jgi:hypothetical protein
MRAPARIVTHFLKIWANSQFSGDLSRCIHASLSGFSSFFDVVVYKRTFEQVRQYLRLCNLSV